MSTLGIIGGMGVQATGRFYEILTESQNALKEQDYLDVLLYSKPSIPDRTAFITGQSAESPLEPLLHAARVLENAGVSSIAMPCVTAHYFYKDLTRAVNVPVLNMLEETARYAAGCGYSKVGLLATDGTIHGRFFHEALAAHGVETIVPEAEGQRAIVALIYNLKRGKRVDTWANVEAVATNLHDRGAQAAVLGCTELSLMMKTGGTHSIDALEILAHAALRACGIR